MMASWAARRMLIQDVTVRVKYRGGLLCDNRMSSTKHLCLSCGIIQCRIHCINRSMEEMGSIKWLVDIPVHFTWWVTFQLHPEIWIFLCPKHSISLIYCYKLHIHRRDAILRELFSGSLVNSGQCINRFQSFSIWTSIVVVSFANYFHTSFWRKDQSNEIEICVVLRMYSNEIDAHISQTCYAEISTALLFMEIEQN
jgi:hypothetical protein